MSPRLRSIVGLITVAVYGGVGAVLLASDVTLLGGGLIALAILRLVLWARHMMSLRAEP